MSNYANTRCSYTQLQSRGIASYEEIGQTRVPEPRAIGNRTRPRSDISCISYIRITLFVEAVRRSVSRRILYIYVLYTRVNRGRDRLTCIILAKKRMFTRSFFFPDADDDGMTSCTYVIFSFGPFTCSCRYII